MTTEQSPSQIGTSQNQCGACKKNNPAEAKFCAGCGQSLVEPCIECSKPVLLTQEFCGSCGTNLKVELQKRIEKLNQLLGEAVEDAKESRFSEALSALNRICREKDYRLREVTDRAQQVRERVSHLEQEGTANAGSLLQRAVEAHEQRNPELAIELLEKIPANLLDDQAKQLLRECRGFVDQVTGLNVELQSAMESKDWKLMGAILTQLSTLVPENTNYKQISAKIAKKAGHGSKQSGCIK